MIDFKCLILAACFVTALGYSTKRQEEKEIGRQVTFGDGFTCTLICQNRPNIIGRTAKCFITHEEKVHTTLVRNPGYGGWLFYTVDDVDIEEDKLCEEVIAGDAFLKNQTETICPSSVKYAERYATVVLEKRKDVSPPADNSYRNDDDDMKTLINELDGAVNKVFRNTDVTTKQFPQVDKRANAIARKVVKVMNYLKNKVGLHGFGGKHATSTASPPYDIQNGYENEYNEIEYEPSDGEEEYNNFMRSMRRRSDDNYMTKIYGSEDDYRSTESDEVAELVSTLVNMMKKLMDVDDDSPISPSVDKYLDDDFSNYEKKGLSYIAPPTFPPYNPTDFQQRSGDSSRNKNKGFSYVAPPTSPPYNPTDYRQQGDDSMEHKEGLSYILPPTSPPYNPNDSKRRHKPTELHEEDNRPAHRSVFSKRGYDFSKYRRKGLSYIAPPTFPPYNPTDFKQKHEPEELEDENYEPTRPSVPKQRKDKPSRSKKGFSYIAPPTSPPYNPNDFKERDSSIKEKGFSYIAPPTFPPYNPTDYRQQGDDSMEHKEGLSYILPPTSPPYNPNDSKRRHKPEELDKEGNRPARRSIFTKRGYDFSKYRRKGLSYIAPPTFPPYNPTDYKREHAPTQFDEEEDRPNHSGFINKKGEIENSTYPPPTTHPYSSKKRNADENDIIRDVRAALEELTIPYERPDVERLKKVVKNLYEKVSQLDNTKKRAVAQSENRVKRNSQTVEETDQTLKAKYHVFDFDAMDALCGLMTTRLCEETKLLHCKKDNTCCWAHINPSMCSESNYDGFKECYTGLTNILDTLMT